MAERVSEIPDDTEQLVELQRYYRKASDHYRYIPSVLFSSRERTVNSFYTVLIFCVIILHFYLHQVNEVNGGDNVFVRCVSVCLCVHSGPVNQTSLKGL